MSAIADQTGPLYPFAALAVTVGSGYLLRLIGKIVKSRLALHALQALISLAPHIVASLAQTVVADLKKDRKFDKQMARDVKERAISEIKAAGAPFVAQALSGGFTTEAIDTALGHVVESNVSKSSSADLLAQLKQALSVMLQQTVSPAPTAPTLTPPTATAGI